MDVTSLLNSNPSAAEQRKRVDGTLSKAPPRNRTPWDAGGYSLPINTASHLVKITTPPLPEKQPLGNQVNDIQISTPPSSPKHGFSDSRGSISSFGSSLVSATTHSRYSSISTLGSNFHSQHKSQGTDILSPELRSISQALDTSTTLNLAIDSIQANGSRQVPSTSPAGSPLEQLALVAECRSSEEKSEAASRRNDSEVRTTGEPSLEVESGEKTTVPFRPGSPSDAILIKRTSIPTLRLETGDFCGSHKTIVCTNSALERHHHSSVLQNKTHKRTSSEPYFRPTAAPSLVCDSSLKQASTAFSTPSYHRHLSPFAYRPHMERSSGRVTESTSPPSNLFSLETRSASIPEIASSSTGHFAFSVGPQPEPTPPPSHHPDDNSPTSPLTDNHAAPLTATGDCKQTVALTSALSTETIACMYVANCDTGSQLRKAISHIFGRNKMCTRQIPDTVWVFYCRKHYQRVRYRNPKMYAQLQCNLVQEQLKRIHLWSEGNRTSNRTSGVVLDWKLAVRKREQKRFEEKKRAATNKKRKRVEPDADHDNEEEERDDDSDDNCKEAPTPLTAVPEWLRAKCQGDKYDIGQVLAIFNRLHREILNETGLTSFPDLEILPNISVDHDAPKSPKGYNKRNPGLARPSGAAGHQRSVSMTSIPSSQHSAWGEEFRGPEPSMHDLPHRSKKRRPSTDTGYVDNITQPLHQARSRIPHPAQQQRFSARPMYPHEEYPEDQPEEHTDGYRVYSAGQQNSFQPRFHPGYDAPMVAPVPRRSTQASTASRLEHEHGRYHSRSRSDAGFMSGEPRYALQPPSYHGHNPYQPHPSYTSSLQPHEQAYHPLLGRPYSSQAPPQYHAPHPQYPPISETGQQQQRFHIRHQSTPNVAYDGPPVSFAHHSPQTFAPAPPPRRSPLPPQQHVLEEEETRLMSLD